MSTARGLVTHVAMGEISVRQRLLHACVSVAQTPVLAVP